MPETDIETERQVRRLEEQFKRLSITDSEGDLETGFAIRIEPISVSPTTAPTTGACCCPDDPTCFIATETDCVACCPICTYFGNGSTCDPNPCGGACCHDDGSCTDTLNETDCTNVGGTYHGDGTVCDPNPCPPPCPIASLVCDSISASSSKCGFDHSYDPSIPLGTVYKTKNVTNTVTDDCPPDGLCCCAPITGNSECPPWGCNRHYYVGSCPQEYIKTITEDCSSGGGTVCGDDGVTCETLSIKAYCFNDCQGNCHTGNCDDGLSIPLWCTTPECGHAGVATCSSVTSTFSYSDEFTDSEVCANTIADLPGYDGIYDDACGATISSGDTCSITRYKYKFLLSSPAPAGMTVDWDQSGPDGVVHHTWTAIGGETETPVFTENESSVDGTTTTINIAVACP